MKIQIKQVTLEMLEDFYRIFSDTVKKEFPEYSEQEIAFILSRHWRKERYEELLKSDSRFILVAEVDGKLVGVLDAEDPFIGVGYCSWLMVAKKYQKQGVGSRLLAEWERVARSKGAHYLYLHSGEKNNPYYEKMGFKLQGNMEKAWFGQDHYIYAKHLQEPKKENYLK